MKTILNTFIFLLIAVLSFSQQNRGFKSVNIEIDGQITELYKQSHALVIGESNYTNGWPDLPGVVQDVEEIQSALEQHDFNVVLVKNPNEKELEKAINDFIDKYGLDENNRLLVYFAGHGHTQKATDGRDMGYIVPADAPLPQNNNKEFHRKAISMQQIDTYARDILSKHALFLFDACFSGSLFALSRAVPSVICYKTREAVRQFITSGSTDETVPDKSIFREQFIIALTTDHADGSNDGYLTATELGMFLQDKVVNYSYDNQHPQYGKIRDKYLDKGDFVFVLNTSQKSKFEADIKEPEREIEISEKSFVTYGTIELSTEIDGSLYLDGTFQKQLNTNTLITLKNITTGNHTLKISGENEWTKKITVYKDNTTSITASKQKLDKSNKTTSPHENSSAKSRTFTDTRDRQRYDWILIGEQTWMAENLNYETNNSWCYDNKKANCETFGRLYDWNAAMKACPHGWHMPSDDEWKVLIEYFGGWKIAGKKLKSKSGWKKSGNGNNESGFSSLPGGNYNGSSFYTMDSYGYWWSSTQTSSTYAWIRNMFVSHGSVYRNDYSKTYCFSVRCLRD